MGKLFKRSGEGSVRIPNGSKVKVIGVGCGGCNVVNYMYANGFKNVPFAVCDMDAAVMERSEIPEKLLLGDDGLGAGNNPAKAESEAENKITEIRGLLADSPKVLFIVSCMGGGFGTGAAPVIARESRKMGITTVGIVTMPFDFEGEHKREQAFAGVRNMSKQTDALFLFNNQFILRNYKYLTVNKAFSKADELMGGVTENLIGFMTSFKGAPRNEPGLKAFFRRLFGR